MSTSGQERIRQQWQAQEPTGKSAQAWLVVRRAVATILALGLIGAFGYWLYTFSNTPKSYLAYYSASIYEPASGAPVAFAHDDFDAIKSLESAFTTSEPLIDPIEKLLTVKLLNAQLSSLTNLASGKDDTLIVFLTAHGRVDKGAPCLLCERSDKSREEMQPLSKVLESLKNVPAQTKLLVLDAGRDVEVANSGTEIIEFSDLVKEAVDQCGDDKLWVLCANSPYEQSHVSPKLRRSLFSYALSQGLSGEADSKKYGDENGEINLEELYEYVRSNVSAWAKDAGSLNETQTPRLLNCDVEQLTPEKLVAMRLVDAKETAGSQGIPIQGPEEDEKPVSSEEKGVFGKIVSKAKSDIAQATDLNETLEKFEHLFGGGHGEGGEEASQEKHGGEHSKKNEPAGDSAHKEGGNAEASATSSLAKNSEQLINLAWQMVGQLESSATQLNPVVIGPQPWRETLERLIWCDHFSRANIPPEANSRWDLFRTEFNAVYKDIEVLAAGAGSEQIDLSEDRPISFALIEKLGPSDPTVPNHEQLQAFIKKYDGFVADDTTLTGSGDFDTRKQKLNALFAPPNADAPAESKEAAVPDIDLHLKNYYEFNLVGRLCQDPEVDWNVLRLMLSSRWLAERVAVDPMCEKESFRKSIEDADSLRLEGERLVLDRTNSNWENLAVQKLSEAKSKYEAAANAANDAQKAIQERNNVLIRKNDYIRWARLVAADKNELDAIQQIVSSLEQLNAQLSAAGGTSIDALERLQAKKRDFDQKANTNKNPWRIANYLATALPSPDERVTLQKEMLELDQKLGYLSNHAPSSDAKSYSPDEVAEEWSRLLDQLNQLKKLDSTILAAESGTTSGREMYAWNSKRFQLAAKDAPEAEVQFLRDVAESYRRLANGPDAPDEQAIKPIARPAISFGELPNEILLDTKDHDFYDLTFSVVSNALEEKPIWLVAQYDDKRLGVAPSQTKLAETSTQYPIRPDTLTKEASATLPAGGSSDFKLKITRKSATESGGDAKLILKAISGDDFVRRELNISLPGGGMPDIEVNAPPGIWSPDEHALHPLPNQIQNFSFSVVNRAKAAKSLEVSFLIPEKIPEGADPISLLTKPQTQHAANSVLARYGNLAPFGPPSIAVQLPASTAPVLLVSDPTLAPPANLLSLPNVDPKAEGITLPHGLIVKLTNKEKDVDEVTLRRIEITPARPWKYFNARAFVTASNDGTKKLQIDVETNNQRVIPQDGVRIDVDPSIFSEQFESTPSDYLKAPNYKATINGTLFFEAGNDVTANVDIDGYPRAFIFKIARNAPTGPIEPKLDAAAVRITSPSPGDAFQAPVRDLPVTIEVDAPQGIFDDEGSKAVVQVGIDQQPIRSMEGDQLETLDSDRQFTVLAKSFLSNGTVAIEARVEDWHLQLTTGVSNQKAPVMAWLKIRDEPPVPSDPPVEILLDGAPPKIYAEFLNVRADSPRERKVPFEEDLDIRVSTREREHDLSGIVKVEAVFDSRASKDSKPVPPTEGKAETAASTSWLIKLPTKGMALGKHDVLIRATDLVGNKSAVLRESVEIVPKDKAPAPQPAANQNPPKVDVANDVPVQVLYVTRPIKAKVTLEPLAGPPIAPAITDEQGKHTFSKVPPGKYKLKARTNSAVRNRFPKAEGIDVTVVPAPQKLSPTTINVN